MVGTYLHPNYAKKWIKDPILKQLDYFNLNRYNIIIMHANHQRSIQSWHTNNSVQVLNIVQNKTTVFALHTSNPYGVFEPYLYAYSVHFYTNPAGY